MARHCFHVFGRRSAAAGGAEVAFKINRMTSRRGAPIRDGVDDDIIYVCRIVNIVFVIITSLAHDPRPQWWS